MNESLFITAMTIGLTIMLPFAVTVAVRPFGSKQSADAGTDAPTTIEKIPRFTSFFEHQCWHAPEVRFGTAKVAA